MSDAANAIGSDREVMAIGRVREIWRYPVKSMAGERLTGSHVGGIGLLGDRGWALRDELTGEIHNAKRHPALMQCSAQYCEPPREGSIPHVTIALPDGATVTSDSADAGRRLSELIARRVTLERRRPATDARFYRRRGPGSRLAGRLARYRTGRRLLQWATFRGRLANELRESFGRDPAEPLPDFADVPGLVFEFYTPPGTYFDLYPIHLLTSSTLHRLSGVNPAANWDVRRFRPNVFIETAPATGLVENEWVGSAVRIGEVVVRCERPTIRCAMPMHAQRDLRRDPSVLRTRSFGNRMGAPESTRRSFRVVESESTIRCTPARSVPCTKGRGPGREPAFEKRKRRAALLHDSPQGWNRETSKQPVHLVY